MVHKNSESTTPSTVFSTPAVVGICLGTSIFFVTFAAVTYFCYKRRPQQYKPRPITLKRPTAVKSPGTQTQYYKKSPSPQDFKSPPGQQSPIGNVLSPDEVRPKVKVTQRLTSPSDVKFGVETETVAAQSPVQDDVTGSDTTLMNGKLGKLHYKFRYSFDKTALIVTILKCTDLPQRDGSSGTDPYIKLQLLPDKQHKVKTRVLRKTLNPVYDEEFTFYGINFNQLQGITLHFIVLSFDRYSRDDVLGEVIAPLTNTDVTEDEMEVSRDISPRNLKMKSQGRGELLVSLCFQPAAHRVTVVVLKARNLPKMDITGLSDPYVKIYMYVNGQRVTKKKTHVKKRTLNPVFNESFIFDLPAGTEDLEGVSLEFMLLDWDRVTKNEVIGRLELGGTKTTGSALHHWKEVANSPRRQIAEWHKLKE